MSSNIILFCGRYSDNVLKVWTDFCEIFPSARQASCPSDDREAEEPEKKSLECLLEFSHRIYPHLQLGGARRLVHIYERSKDAKAGFPDGKTDEEENDEEAAQDEVTGDSEEKEKGEEVHDRRFLTTGERKEVGTEITAAEEGQEDSGKERATKNTVRTVSRRNTRSANSTSQIDLKPPVSSVARTEAEPEQSKAESDRLTGSVRKRKRRIESEDGGKGSAAEATRTATTSATKATELSNLHPSATSSFVISSSESLPPSGIKLLASDGHFGTIIGVLRRGKGGKVSAPQDPRSHPPPASELYCACRTPLEPDAQYIHCCVGDADKCNGWLHLSCLRMQRWSTRNLLKLSNFVCEACRQSFAVRSAVNRVLTDEKLKKKKKKKRIQ